MVSILVSFASVRSGSWLSARRSDRRSDTSRPLPYSQEQASKVRDVGCYWGCRRRCRCWIGRSVVVRSFCPSPAGLSRGSRRRHGQHGCFLLCRTSPELGSAWPRYRPELGCRWMPALLNGRASPVSRHRSAGRQGARAPGGMGLHYSHPAPALGVVLPAWWCCLAWALRAVDAYRDVCGHMARR